MANSIINTLEVTNISNQLLNIFVKERIGSSIFTKSGQIAVKPKAKLEAEDDRFDLSQIRQMQKLNLITTQKNRRLVAITEAGSE
jgi:hypothetical protein